MLSLSRPLSRRSVQGLLLGAVAVPLSGCDLNPGSAPVTPAPPTADETLVDRVTARIREVRDLARAVPGAGALADVHEAHLAALGSPTPSSGSPSPSTSPPASTQASPTRGTGSAAALAAAERSLEATLTDAAMRAEDGGLARLLASMAAAGAQQVVALLAIRSAR